MHQHGCCKYKNQEGASFRQEGKERGIKIHFRRKLFNSPSMIHVIRFTCEQTGSTSKEEWLSLAVDTPFPLTELFNFKARLFARRRKITERGARSEERGGGTGPEDRSMDGRGNEPSKPVFSPFVRLKDIFACENEARSREWRNVDRVNVLECRFDVNTVVNEKSGHQVC